MAKTFQTAELQRLVGRDAAIIIIIKTMKSLGFRPVRETRTAARTYRWWSVEAKDALVAALAAAQKPEAPPAGTVGTVGTVENVENVETTAGDPTLAQLLGEFSALKGLLTQLLDAVTAPSRGAAS